jgi:phosphonate metabolism protein (transferase hexapeptide repeat family)
MAVKESVSQTGEDAPRVHSSAIVVESALGLWCEVDARVSIIESVLGDYSYVTHDSEIIYTHIGKFCSIASFARINPGNHPLKRAALHHFTYRSSHFQMGDDDTAFFDWRRSAAVRLGNDVWVGHGSVILPGVTVATGAVIGAGSVVTKDVPAFTIVAGTPAKPLHARFTPEIQAALLRIAWWDWTHRQLQDAMEDFRNLDGAGFAGKYDPL